MSHVPSHRLVLCTPDRRIAGWVLLGLAALVLAAGLSMGAPSSADALPRLMACTNNIDDDGDGKIDNFDPGCQNGRDDNETDPATAAQCSDQKDNEAVPDTKIDFPFDPGCPFAGNNNEADPAVVPQCADGLDNEPAVPPATVPGDGKIDFPADLDCAWAADPLEITRACSDRQENDVPPDGKIDWPADLGCPGPNNNNEADPPQCNDGRDNDGDGKIDTDTNLPGQTADPGCSSPTDNDETDPPPGPGPAPAACADGKDNDGDGDGKIDFPADPGCTSAADTDEVDPPPGLPAPAPASCADGRDNDGDGKIDFPADPGCTSAADDDEGPLTVLLPSSTDPELLAPFPVVRLRGRISRTSARITLLTVSAPATSQVSVYCAGRSCPLKWYKVRAGRKTVRVRRFERRLRAGTVLRIYVTKPGFVGKYTRFQIRRGRSPLRTDLCAQTPASTPRRCPAS